jgi:hypothetical protein
MKAQRAKIASVKAVEPPKHVIAVKPTKFRTSPTSKGDAFGQPGIFKLADGITTVM